MITTAMMDKKHRSGKPTEKDVRGNGTMAYYCKSTKSIKGIGDVEEHDRQCCKAWHYMMMISTIKFSSH